VRWAGWAVLGALILYRRTWGSQNAEEIQGLRRRLVAAHREVAGYQVENRAMAVQLYGEEQDRCPTWIGTSR
jgi:hypothetical protein